MKFGSSQIGVGKSVARVEDSRLLTGRGRYTDDVQLPGLLHAVTLRSPHGHAEIRGIDTSAARAVPGVKAIYTAADVADYGEIPCIVPLSGPIRTPRRLLAEDRVRFVGDGVAFVVAETREQARAAAEAIEVDYAELPAVASIEAAIAPDAPRIWPDAPSNDLFLWEAGDRAAAESAIASAPHVTRLRIVQNRVAPTSMEVRAAVGEWADGAGFTLHVGSQGVAGMRAMLAGMVMKCPPEQLRIVTGDVGGGFGMKTFIYPEYALVLHAARALGRPVK
ncbi:MAG: xanthine dehydrogenase family protein molybdopterin-binding subunit, partial [Sphingomonadaceae bacterium]